ncbi:chain length determinant protein EpsF [Ramlibacter ginsenosidimutans]|uniref:Chain length determinant protein EpsF n=1 Tax=Ramlibacter ginsenosidimutans TaxID=502333 RepID=A0A934TTL9_9BURK|nr:chain length determinant protein EpsF [Ramlibacter ginsenosidimutans]MBK6006685.1 chain length determinant protein EpsF [Ramlibacter ginsenosidimutans]
MRLHQFFSIVRARSRLGIAIFLGVLALAAVWLVVRTPSYVARAPVLVDVRTDPVGSTPVQGMVTPGYVATQIDVVKSRAVAERAAKLLPADQEPMLRLKGDPGKGPVPEEAIISALQQGLQVTPARESNIIQIGWTGRSPQEAARVANAFAEAYMATNVDLKTKPAKQYTAWFDQQMQQARERLQAAQAKLAQFQQKSGLISTSGQADYEQQRLTELTTQLLAAQGHRTSPVASGGDSAEVSNLRGEVSRLQAKVDEASQNLGPNHPKMIQMNAELRSMQSRLAEASARAGQVVAGAGQASAARVRELQSQLDAQKARVLSLARDRGEFNVLEQEVTAAQKAFDTVAADAAQSRLQSLSTQGNVVFLGAASAPLQPVGLSSTVALALAAVCGLILALLGSLLAEIANRRVRSKEDLESITGLPILGMVPAPSARVRLLPMGGGRPQLSFSRSAA